MKPQRFETLMKEELLNANVVGLKAVSTFAEAEYRDKPLGIVLELESGARVFVQLVGTSPPGGATANNPVEGDPLPAAEVPGLPSSGRVRLADIEQLLQAVATNCAPREFTTVRRFSTRDEPGMHPYGLEISARNGAQVYALFVQVSPPGGTRSGQVHYQVPQEI